MHKADEVITTTRGAMWRSRWAAIGAAMAVIAGLGGLGVAFASGGDSSTVTITPCRLLDTRPGLYNTGGRNTPLGQGETFSMQAVGKRTNCAIPSAATALVMNVTVVDGTANSYLTVWPQGAARPLSSNLNWNAGAGPTPNQVTVGLSAGGNVSFYNFAGTVNVVADVVGYLTGSAPQRLSVQNAAQGRWDKDRGRPAVVGSGDGPSHAVSDGRYLWVTDQNAGSVQRIDPDTNFGGFSLGGMTNPMGIAWDGTYLWVASNGTDAVWRINPVSNAVVVVPVGNGPTEVLYDGAHVWVTNFAANSVSRIDPGSATVTATTALGAATGPVGMAFDGTSLYVAEYSADKVVRLNTATASVTATVVVGNGPKAMVYDGEYVWATNSNTNTLTMITPDTMDVFISAAVAAGLNSITYDGTDLWVGASFADSVYRVNRRTISVTQTRLTPAAPVSLAWDGTNIWIPCFTADKVAKILPQG